MTTLAAPISAADTFAATSGASDRATPFLAQIDDEYVEVRFAGGPLWEISRAALGTGRSAHASGSDVTPLTIVAQTLVPVSPPIDTAVLGDSAYLPTSDEKDALDGAASPTADNPFATIADVTTDADLPTADQKAALDAAASPSADNAFATIADVATLPTSDEKAALDAAASPSADNAIATIADLPTTPGLAAVTAVDADPGATLFSSAAGAPGGTLTTFLYLDTTAVTGGTYAWDGTAYVQIGAALS